MTLRHGFRLTDRQLVLVATGGIGDWSTGRVLEISQEACRLAMPEVLPPGTAIAIMFPGFTPRSGRVVEVGADLMLCRFDEPLPTSILDYLIRMSDTSTRG